MQKYEVIKNTSYSLSANVVSLLVSVFMVMFVPKFLSVDEYGLWQLFLFYFSYLGFLHLGWEDGIYLRYAGKDFKDLNVKVMSGQFYSIFLLQIVLALLVTLGGRFLVGDPVKRLALFCAIWLAPIVNFNNLCNFIMQITNRIKDYAKMLFTEQIVFFFGVLLVITLGSARFINMYYAKLLSVSAVFCIGAYTCRTLLKPDFDTLPRILAEARINISVGSKLMFANIAGMLIVGVIRYGISIGWDVATFGRVSLTLGISNFLMVFITSVSVVFFPIIKSMDDEKRSEMYIKIRDALTVILFAALIGYYPLRFILGWWLPKYEDSLIYMSILFPVCLFESKMSLLANSYLKSMREEVLIFQINAVSVITSIILTVITVGILHDLDAAVLSIVIVSAFRCTFAEYFMEGLLHISLTKEIITDFLMAGVFMITGWFLNNWLCTVIYAVAYTVFLFIYRNRVKNIVSFVRS